MLDAADLIRASERLEAITDGAASAGTLKKGASRQHIESLTKRLNRETTRDAHRRTVPASAMRDLAAFGIRVETPISKAGND